MWSISSTPSGQREQKNSIASWSPR
jgi:hypothetical protein